MSEKEALMKSLLAMDRLAVKNMMENSRAGQDPIAFVETTISPVLEAIGKGWEEGRYALSQVYMSGTICEDLIDELLPPSDPQSKDQPPMAVSVLDDYHLLGKRIVCSVLRAGGFEIADFGRATVDELITRVENEGIQILLLSVLMLPSALKIREVTQRLKEKGLEVKTVVGGAPFLFDSTLWQEVGADAMGQNASDALNIISQMTGGAA